MSKRQTVRLAVCLALLLLWLVSLIAILWGNTALELHPMTVTDSNLPAAFDGFRIAQVSDLHDAQIGKNNSRLIALLREASPDMIVLTGDMIDSNRTNVSRSLQAITEIAAIAPCYYVTGNHEADIDEADYAALERGMLEAGVVVLHNRAVLLERAGDTLLLAGIDDPKFEKVYETKGYRMSASYIKTITKGGEYTVLLSHRPQYFERYVEAEVNLVLSGHVHGGQVRLPFVGGVFAPNHALFPRYDAGLYTEGKTQMAVSRGIGNSVLPLRVNNRPEVLLLELKRG